MHCNNYIHSIMYWKQIPIAREQCFGLYIYVHAEVHGLLLRDNCMFIWDLALYIAVGFSSGVAINRDSMHCTSCCMLQDFLSSNYCFIMFFYRSVLECSDHH